jgi:hypothetical protein
MRTPNLDPKTRTVNVSTLKVGHIVVESHGHPAIVVRIARRGRSARFANVYCRYVWQASGEPPWLLGDATLSDSHPVERAV